MDDEGAAILGLQMDGGELQRIPPNATRDDQIAVINSVVDRLNGLLKTQVFSDGSNKRMLFGFQQDGWGTGKDFGIKISQEGVDVTKATEDQLLFSMDMDRWLWFNDGDAFALLGLRPNGNGSGLWVSDEDVDVRDKVS